MRFTKVEGLGNDFVAVRASGGEVCPDPSALAREVCSRKTGIGADGLLILEPARDAAARMVVWNADGSRSDMCGNALRCVGLLLARDHGLAGEAVVATDAGSLAVTVLERDHTSAIVRAAVGRPVFDPAAVPCAIAGSGPVLDVELEVIPGSPRAVSAVRVGNPVAVLWTERLSTELVPRYGQIMNADRDRFPDGVNVAFAEVIDRGTVGQRTYERGCGETAACGTAAAAVCVVGVLSGQTDRSVEVVFAEGALRCEWPDDASPVMQTGPARIVFDGDWPESGGGAAGGDA